MDLEDLRTYLDRLVVNLKQEDKKLLEARLESLTSVFPFNTYEYILMFLVDRRVIPFVEYEKLRGNYVSTNRYLDLFGLAPRIFGQIWGEKHLSDISEKFKKPDRSLDKRYDGQYDLWMDGIRIEVKAARAINTKKRGDLVSKALKFKATAPFWMNFQQIKLDICDAFVFIGVWVDTIVYWVMSNEDIKTSKYLSHQHRGGIEYQIGITRKNIHEFESFRVSPQDIITRITNMAKKRAK
jgi:hypothetical protein